MAIYRMTVCYRRLGHDQTFIEMSSDSKSIDYVYEVPLLSSLKQLLSDPFILEEVRKYL